MSKTTYKMSPSSLVILREAVERTKIPRIGYMGYHEGHITFCRRSIIKALCKLGVKKDAARYHARKQSGAGTVLEQFDNALQSIGYTE